MGRTMGCGPDRSRRRMVKRAQRSRGDAWTSEPGSRPLIVAMISLRRPSLRVQGVVLVGLLAAAACNATVDPIGAGPGGSGATTSTADAVGGSPFGSGGDGGIGTASGGGSPTAAGGAGPTSIALFESEVPPGGTGEGGFGSAVVTVAGVGGGEETTSGGVGAGGAPPDGERLLLVIENLPVSCSDLSIPCGSTGARARIWLPPGQQDTGTLVALATLDAGFTEWSYDDECISGGSGGDLVEGTIEILSADATSLVVNLVGSPVPSLEGLHTVSRCSPIPIDESSAIAYFPSELPGDGAGGGKSAAVTSSGGGGQENYFLDFADHAVSCVDPSPTPDPGRTFERYRISLPFELVTAVDQTYALSDPRITTTYNEESENTGSTGQGGSPPGTITITGFSATHVSVVVDGTGHEFVDGEWAIPRCGG